MMIKKFNEINRIKKEIDNIKFILTDLGFGIEYQILETEGRQDSSGGKWINHTDINNSKYLRVLIISNRNDPHNFIESSISEFKKIESTDEFSEFMDRIIDIIGKEYKIDFYPMPFQLNSIFTQEQDRAKSCKIIDISKKAFYNSPLQKDKI